MVDQVTVVCSRQRDDMPTISRPVLAPVTVSSVVTEGKGLEFGESSLRHLSTESIRSLGRINTLLAEIRYHQGEIEAHYARKAVR